MIYKRCGYCGQRVPEGSDCQRCGRVLRSADKHVGVKKKYNTSRWGSLRNQVKARYNYMDVYAWLKYGRIEPAEIVHHIRPARENEERFYQEENLIPVSVASHTEIHLRYKKEKQSDVEKELIEMLERYRSGAPGVGKKV